MERKDDEGSDDGWAARPCPTCGRPAMREHRPFCSRRCADVDLGRWLGGAYAIPVAAPEGGGDEQ
jgi:hypothetical protein